jgi:hypothetical protein
MKRNPIRMITPKNMQHNIKARAGFSAEIERISKC